MSGIFNPQPTSPLVSPSLTLRFQSGRTDPESAAACFSEIATDLARVFVQIDFLGHAMRRREALNRALLGRLRGELERAGEDFEQIADGTEPAENSVTLSFQNIGRQELDEALYVNSQATVDPVQETLTLPLLERRNVAPQGQIRLVSQVGCELAGAYNTPLAAAVDGRPDTHWAAFIPAPTPLAVSLEAPGARVDSGAAVLLELALPVATTVNKLMLSPYAVYPVEIVAVLMYETNNPDEEPYLLVSPDHRLQDYRSVATVDPVSYVFPDMPVSRVQVLLNQRHYVRRERAQPAEVSYDYRYGLAGLELWSSRYGPVGEFVSQPFGVRNNLRFVRIQTESFLPRLPNPGLKSQNVANVEYDVAPEGGAWLPILPVDEPRVLGERVWPVFDGHNWRSVLRFPVAGGLRLYRNGQLLAPAADYVANGQGIRWLDPFVPGIYTADYVPGDTAWRVPLWEAGREPRLVTESFDGTDVMGLIKLLYQPYTDHRLISSLPQDWDPSVLGGPYVPVRVQIIQPDGLLLEQPAVAGRPGLLNATPYRPRFAAPDGPHYVVDGDTIQFNRPWTEGQMISVTYPVGITTVRMRITARRHLEAYQGLTPAVRCVTCNFETLR